MASRLHQRFRRPMNIRCISIALLSLLASACSADFGANQGGTSFDDDNPRAPGSPGSGNEAGVPAPADHVLDGQSPGDCADGSGPAVVADRNLSGFRAVRYQITGALRLVDNLEGIRIETAAAVQNVIKTEVIGDELVISADCYQRASVIVQVPVAGLRAVALDGAADVSAIAAINADQWRTELAGAGTITLRGTARNHEVEIGGAGDVVAFDFPNDAVNVEVGGAGTAYVHARQQLNAVISGAGNVVYQGDPQVTEQILGAGAVSRSQD